MDGQHHSDGLVSTTICLVSTIFAWISIKDVQSIAALIASGLCLSCIGVIWLFQTDQSHNETVYGIVKTVTNISIGILVTGILLALAKKN